MENPISSSGMVWCLIALLFLLTLSIAASVQARLNLRGANSSPTATNPIAYAAQVSRIDRMTLALLQLSPGNIAIGFMRAHCAPAHGKEYAPC
jgi:hypothetical protein